MAATRAARRQERPEGLRAGSDRGTAEKQADAEAAEGEKGKGAPATGTETSDTGTGGSHAGRADGGTPVTAPVEGGPARRQRRHPGAA